MIKIISLLAFIISLNASNTQYVKMCVDPDGMPMESIDKNGKYIGIAADVLNLIEQKTNFKFILIPTKTWEETISFIKQKKCDILPLASITNERKKWLNFTPSFINYSQVLVVRANENKRPLEEIVKLPIGLTKGYAAIPWFKNKFPNINIVEVDNADEAFAKLRSGEIYSFSDPLPIVGYKLQEEGILDLKISYAFDKEVYNLSIGMGVIKGKDELYNQLTMAINNLNEKKLNAILEKWVQINIDDISFDYILAFKILGSIFLIAGVFLFWSYELESMVKVKTKELEDSAKELEDVNNELEDVNQKLKEANGKLEELNDTLEDQVKVKTKDIKHLLDNAGQGFLTLNEEFLIGHEYSRECEEILGKEIANKEIAKIFFDDIQKANKFKENLNIVLSIKNKNSQFFAISLLPDELIINEKTVEIEYKVTNSILMLILTDVTEKKKLKSHIKNEQITLKMIVSIIKDNDVFFDVKNDFKHFADNRSDYVDESKASLYNTNEIYKTIDTFKGSFLRLFMKNTASHLDNVKSKISDILHHDEMISNKQLLDLLQKIKFETFINTDLENIVKILGESFLNKHKFVLVKKQFLETIEDKCLSLANRHKEDDIDSILKSVRVLSKKSLKSYLEPYVRLSLQMSVSAKKPINEFEIMGDEDIILPEKFIKFIYSLVHVFRNAIVHGIEDSETRNYLNKNRTGTISCSFIKKDNTLEIIISDDGAGINVEKIKEKVGNKNLTEQEAYSCIFKDNFSTSDDANALSKRGLGLGDVKTELGLLDGDIKVYSELDIGTRFIFTIPV